VDGVGGAAVAGSVETLAGASLLALAAAMVLQVLKLGARARAWQNILRAAFPEAEVRFGAALQAYLSGVGVNAVTPGRPGELVRLGLARSRIEGATMPPLLSSLAVEALLDGALTAAVLGWAVFGSSRARLAGGPVVALVSAHPFVSAAAAGALVALIGLLAWRCRTRFLRAVDGLARGVAVLRTPRRYLTRVASWQALGWALRVGSVFAFLSAFHLAAGLSAAALVVAVQIVSSFLVVAPGGVGVQQALLTVALGGSSGVLALGIGMQAATVLVDVAAGASALTVAGRSLRWRTTVRRARLAPDAA
jgi:uncharacterized membrane protein YbhN (UPF0104 family)